MIFDSFESKSNVATLNNSSKNGVKMKILSPVLVLEGGRWYMKVDTDIDGLRTRKEVGRVEYSMVKPGLILAVDLGKREGQNHICNMIIKTDSENVAMMMGTGELFYIMPNHSVESIHKFKYIPYADTIGMVDISDKRSEWLLKNDS